MSKALDIFEKSQVENTRDRESQGFEKSQVETKRDREGQGFEKSQVENKRDREGRGFGAEEVEVILAEAEEAARKNPHEVVRRLRVEVQDFQSRF